jgi:tRNA-2-methylthio-N6-dimethylallyladenosine synthase
VLVEGPSRKDAAEMTGRTECNRMVNFKGASRLKGQMIDVRITAVNTHSLRGEVVQRDFDTNPDHHSASAQTPTIAA